MASQAGQFHDCLQKVLLKEIQQLEEENADLKRAVEMRSKATEASNNAVSRGKLEAKVHELEVALKKAQEEE